MIRKKEHTRGSLILLILLLFLRRDTTTIAVRILRLERLGARHAGRRLRHCGRFLRSEGLDGRFFSRGVVCDGARSKGMSVVGMVGGR